MSTLFKPAPRVAEPAPVTRGGAVRPSSPPLAVHLVRVTLPEQGDELNGKALCEQLRRFLNAHPGPCCFFLEGTGMVNARIGFANAFKELDREWGARMEVVCAIPLPIPRMMAHTVATMAQASWHIFRTRAEAELHLQRRGYLAAEGSPSPRGPVHASLQPLS
ncbi:hypothetical protein F0U62_08130 [Cystobacter fuscus]|uniref:hypothetical protein n=1 Tax=Cystobacter fuscus TaxID=43 RepID=UPI002B28CC57|nr:hypothetical protein F0U62_08130 [Cystobacter fuscus]